MTEHGYQAITGHEEEIRQLRTAVLTDHVSHAYLFLGEEGSGKALLSEAFALSLVCERHDGEPCLTCPSCKKAMDHNHPDIIHVTHEKPNHISVDEIRTQVVNTMDIRPYEGGRKIYVIDDAQKMNPQAQNALLKTIEEPPAYAVIILLSSSQEALLPTILSRCVKLSMKPVADELVEDYLMNKLQLPDYEARILSAFAQGNIGRARSAAIEDEFSEMKEAAIGLVKRIWDMDTAAISESIKTLREMKDRIGDYLDMLALLFRDILVMKSTRDAALLIFSGEEMIISEEADAHSYENLEQIFSAIDACRLRLNANVNFELALELLFFTIKENKIHAKYYWS